MAPPNSLEKKLDRYYNDIIDKLMEIVETHKNVLGEQKELKKDVAKLKEHLLEAKTSIEQLETVVSNINRAAASVSHSNQANTVILPASQTIVVAQPSPVVSTQQKQSQTVIASEEKVVKAQPAKEPPTPPPKADPPVKRSLKEFLAQEVSIFDVKVLNAFIKATKDVVKSNALKEPAFIKPIIDGKMQFPITVAGRMQLARDKGKGAMAFCLCQESASEMTRAVLVMPEQETLSSNDIKDVTSEICNQICGKSKVNLKNDGYSFDIGLPEIHQGKTSEIMQSLGKPNVALFFEFNKQPFYIFFWG